MIGERTAIPARGGSLGARSRPSLRRRWTAGAAIARRRSLIRALGRSVLVQLMLAMSLVAFAALLYLAQASQASILQTNINILQYDRMQLTVRNAVLHATATKLQSAQRIQTIAVNQLHMTQPDISATVWVSYVAPRVARPRPVNADSVSAQQESQPLAWLQRTFAFVKSSL